MDAWIKYEKNELLLLVSKDDMSAWLIARSQSDGSGIDRPTLLELFSQAQITYGIMDSVIELFLQKPDKGEKILVAQGKAPVAEEWNEFENYFDTSLKKEPTITPDQRINFKEKNFLENVVMQQILVQRKLSRPGCSGMDIHSDAIQPPVHYAAFPPGQNTHIADYDQNLLVSAINGYLLYDGVNVSVLPSFVVDGDIDYKTGNLLFIGDLLIKGDIKEGFEVKTGGNLTIEGLIEKAVVECNGNLTVKGGIIGSPLSTITVKGNCSTFYVENALVNCQGDMRVAKYSHHSMLKIGGQLFVGDEHEHRASIIGGKTIVGKNVETYIIGNFHNTQTVLEVGIDPFLKSQIETTYHEIKVLNEQRRKLEQQLDFIVKFLQSPIETEIDLHINDLDSRRIEIQDRIPRLKDTLVKKRQLLQKLEIKFTDEINSHKNEYGRIVARSTIFPGVRILIRNTEWTVGETMEGMLIVETDNHIESLKLE